MKGTIMENNEIKTEKSKLDHAKNAAEILVLTATAVTAAKGLYDLGVDVKDAIKIRRAKKAAKNQQD